MRDVEFLRGHTTKPIKITVPGPFTMSQQAQDYGRSGARYGLCGGCQRRDRRPSRRRREGQARPGLAAHAAPLLWLLRETMQDYLGYRDPKHTAHYRRVAGRRFEGLW